MTQPFADALTWVPKSRALGATLGRAHDLTRAQGHAEVTLEHLLLSLIEDPDASALLLSCGVDLLSLNSQVASHLQQQPGGEAALPGPAPALLTILEYAVTAARQSRRAEINGAIVVAAIVGEGSSVAARLLQAGGLKFEDAVQALRRAVAPRPAAEPAKGAPSPASPVAADGAAGAGTSEAPVLPSPVAEQQSPAAVQSATGLPPFPSAPTQVAPSAAPEPSAPAHVPPMPLPAPVQQVAETSVPVRQPAHVAEEDPVTTARRRIAAIRNGQPLPEHLPAAVPPALMGTPANSDPGQASFSGSEPQQVAVPPLVAGATAGQPGASTAWMPPPQQHTSPPARAARMPPPVPPIPGAPRRPSGVGPHGGPPPQVPWADPAAPLQAGPAVETVPQLPPPGQPIEPARLAECIPERMQARIPVTVEVRIPRSAVLATAAVATPALAMGRDTSLTRALSVRLKAPAGGFHIENAAPETQWFDTLAARREDDEVRWRWLVTPRHPGRMPLQLSVSMRTIAADGIGMETTLPDVQATVRVGRNRRAALSTWATWVAAATAGATVALLATGGWSMLVR
jgi:hypothetical protein